MNVEDKNPAAGLTRRSFLLSIGVGAVAGVALLAARHWPAVAGAVEQAWPAWLLDDYNRDAVTRLGAAYRAAHSDETEAAVLADYIERALAAAGAAPGATDPVAVLQQRVRHEYTVGEVTRVTGWVLSVTEARLYALASLEAP